jgi:hypothetical protein
LIVAETHRSKLIEGHLGCRFVKLIGEYGFLD